MTENQTSAIGTLMEPDPIRFSFGAPGWFILLGVGLTVLLIYALFVYLRYRKRRYRRDAVRVLENLELSIHTAPSFVTRIAEVLKRVSMISYGRSETAALNGQEWISYLDQRNNGILVLSANARNLLTGYLYQNRSAEVSENELEELRTKTIQWIHKHRV